MIAYEVRNGDGGRLVRRPRPEPGIGEVLVRVDAVGICGSDVELVAGGRDPGFCRLPVVPGHEWAGTVVAHGSDVDRARLPLGASVAVEGHCYCGRCPPCLIGQTQRCERYDEFGFMRDGGYAALVAARADLCHPFHTLSPEEAALTEPTACALHAVERARVPRGAAAVVVGAGPVGLLAAGLLRVAGARPVLVVDPRPVGRLARAMGADRFLAASAGDALAAVIEATDDHGADVVVEAAGTPDAVTAALAMTRRGGTLALLGIAGTRSPSALPTDALVFGDVRVEGVFAYPSAVFARALDLLERGLLDVGPLITHCLPLSEVERALELVRDRAEGVGKVVLRPPGPSALDGPKERL